MKRTQKRTIFFYERWKSTARTNLVEVPFHVVAVKLRPTKDDPLIHVVGVDCSDAVLTFQHLHSLAQCL